MKGNICKIFLTLFLLFVYLPKTPCQENLTVESFLKENLEKRKLETDSNELTRLYNSIAYLYSLKNESEKALSYIDSAYRYSLALKDTVRMIEVTSLRRTISTYQGNMELAMEQSEISYKLSYLFSDTTLYISMALEHAKLLFNQGMTYSAIDSLEVIMPILKKAEHPKIPARALYLKANIMESLGNREEMYSCINECIQLEESYTKSRALIAALVKKAGYLIDDNELTEADSILTIAETHALSNNFEKRLASIFSLQGKIKLLENKYPEAIAKYKAMEAKLSIEGLKGALPHYYSEMSKAYILANNNKLALSKALQAQKFNKESKLLESEKEINLLLSQIYENYGEHEKALLYRINYEASRDSLEEIAQIKQARNLEARFKNEEQQITILKKDKDLALKENELISSASRFKTLTLSFIALFLISLLAFFWFQQRIKNQNQKAKIELDKALLESTEEERERIARELHDSTGSMLTGIKLGLERASEEVGNNEIRENLEMHVKQVQEISHEVRRISHAMAPAAIDRLTFENLLSDLIGTFNSIGGAKIDSSYSGNLEKLNKTERLMLFRIMQECLNNSFKHSEADEIHISLSVEPLSAELMYQDNGKGYDLNSNTDSFGLNGISKRIKYLNGEQTLETEIGEGMLLIASFPLMRT